MKYFFQSMGYNPAEWIKDLQDYSSEWERTQMTAEGGVASGMKIRRFGEIHTDIHWDIHKRKSNCTQGQF